MTDAPSRQAIVSAVMGDVPGATSTRFGWSNRSNSVKFMISDFLIWGFPEMQDPQPCDTMALNTKIYENSLMTWIIWGTSHDLGNLYIIFSNLATHSAPKKNRSYFLRDPNTRIRKPCLLAPRHQGNVTSNVPLNLILPMGNAKWYAVNGQAKTAKTYILSNVSNRKKYEDV